MEPESVAPEPSKGAPDQPAGQAGQVQDSSARPKDYRDDVNIETEPTIDEESFGKSYFKRHHATVILSTAFIILVGLAFVLYPLRKPVYRPQAFQMTIEVNTTLTGALITVEKKAPNRFLLDIYLYTAAPNLTNLLFGSVGLQIPAPASCQSSCRSDLVRNGFFNGQTDYITELISSFKPMTTKTNYIALTGSEWEASAEFAVTAPMFAWDENGLDIEAQLPAVQLLAFPGQSLGDPNIWIYYALSSAVYDWAGGPLPNYFYRPPGQPSSVVAWRLPVKELSGPSPVSGTDSATADEDSFRTFVSGVLLGTAGGAIVAAIQEAGHSKRRKRARTAPPTKLTASPTDPR
jgi:hypothetical protein